MMLRKMITNKKVVMLTLAVLLALIVGIAILVTPNSEETGGKEPQGNDSTKLEILEPDELVPEDSSDVSGSWNGTSGSNTQIGDANSTEQTEQTDQIVNQDQNEDQEDDGKEPEKVEDILDDGKTWGNVY